MGFTPCERSVSGSVHISFFLVICWNSIFVVVGFWKLTKKNVRSSKNGSLSSSRKFSFGDITDTDFSQGLDRFCNKTGHRPISRIGSYSQWDPLWDSHFERIVSGSLHVSVFLVICFDLTFVVVVFWRSLKNGSHSLSRKFFFFYGDRTGHRILTKIGSYSEWALF